MDQRSVRDILAGKTYFIRTFGCQMNQHDSERVSGLLDSYGCLMALDPAHADIVVFMTCCVREAADTRLYGQCNSCKSLPPSPSGKRVVAVGGCIAQRDGEGLLTNVDNVNVIFGTHSIAHVAELIAEAFRDGKRHIRTNEHEDTDAMSMPWHRETQYHAWVPIMTGCNNFCTYCVIPYTRGRIRSLPLDEMARQAAHLAAEGYRELVLTGIEIASYGRDLPGALTLADAVETVAAAAPQMRLRLGSLEPTVITEDFCRRAAATGRVCRHFHLSLQSGCDRTLARMNRKYSTAEFLVCVERLRRYFPGCALTADMITGFPGETEEEFEDTIKLIEHVRYDALFTFIFSPRGGTPAAKMEDPTPKEEKNRRFDRLCEVQNRISLEIHQNYIGKTMLVLVDGKDGDQLTARTEGGRLVRMHGDDALIGQFVHAKITGCTTWSLVGELAE